MENGVIIIDFSLIFIGIDVKIGIDIIIELGVCIGGYIMIEEDVWIG